MLDEENSICCRKEGCQKCKKFIVPDDDGESCETCYGTHFMYHEAGEDNYTYDLCQRCNQDCQTCIGPNKNDCMSCSYSFHLNSIAPNYCCQSSCIACIGASLYECTSCSRELLHLGNNKPPNSCCDKTCLTCDGIEESNCLSCYDGLYLEQTNQTCAKCHQTCLTCNNSTNFNCLSCDKNLILFQNQCLVSCPSGYNLIVDLKKCVEITYIIDAILLPTSDPTLFKLSLTGTNAQYLSLIHI
eukprot:TRINITY_DN2027_c0_g1_i3.p2 TRINITY_DN2027_c0_g1~~TRINITY_DN2027_c0_g1_i3.p2  ORF type:complete len:243 (-),score=27.51 TRINITY_DN2027_c0_g1_i3:64-792(-)